MTRAERMIAFRSLCEGLVCSQRQEIGEGRLPVLAGWKLCRICRQSLADGLKKLPELYDECGRALNGPGKQGQPRERKSGPSASGMPFNAAAADVRAEILAVLGSWSGMVVQQRGVTAPRRTVYTLAKFLGIHVDWIAAHPAAGDATTEVAQLVRSARRVADPGAVQRVAIGACVDTECAGELVALLNSGDVLRPTEITCTADPRHSWPAHRWIQLSSRLETVPASTPPGTRWLSAADISRLWGLPTGSVYRLASERRWRRHSQAGRTCYYVADVEHTLNQRELDTGAC
jgi:hypothetical protein